MKNGTFSRVLILYKVFTLFDMSDDFCRISIFSKRAILRCDNESEHTVESKMGAVILGFRWLLASLSIRRLNSTCHDSVSHPRPIIVPIKLETRIGITTVTNA